MITSLRVKIPLIGGVLTHSNRSCDRSDAWCMYPSREPRLGARQRPAAHREACRSLTWRLIRDSIAAMPRSRGWSAPRPGRRSTGAPSRPARPPPPGTAASGTPGPAPSGPGARRSVPAGAADPGRTPAAAAAGPCPARRGSRRRSPAAGGSARRRLPAASSRAVGSRAVPAGDRDPDAVAPLGPRAVVVAHVAEAEQVLQHEPGVAGTLADAAVDDHVVVRAQPGLALVDGLEFLP